MSVRFWIEAMFDAHVTELVACDAFTALESGEVSDKDYDQFLANVVRAHLKSPQILAFLYALAPPEAAGALLHNMLEELGLDDETGVAHPSLLRQLAVGAGLEHRLPELEAEAVADLRRVVVDPILYGSLKEMGLAALCEVVAFEFMLSRVAGRIAIALARHRGLSSAGLEWFTHHSAVDVAHAEQGFDSLDAYIQYYKFSEEDVRTIVEMTMRENAFIKRYFRDPALARSGSVRA